MFPFNPFLPPQKCALLLHHFSAVLIPQKEKETNKKIVKGFCPLLKLNQPSLPLGTPFTLKCSST